MLKQAKNFLNSVWLQIGLVVGAVLLLLRMKGKYDTALVSEKLGNLRIKDAKEEAKSEERTKRITSLEKDKKKAKLKKRTTKEVEEFYNERSAKTKKKK